MATFSSPSAEVLNLPRLKSRSRYFFPVFSILMIAVVFTGFWPSYFGPLITQGRVVRPLIIHLHGAIFLGWMALLIAQVILAAIGKVRAHRSLGTLGIAYGLLVVVMGLIATFAAPVLHVRAGEWDVDRAAGFLPIPIGDMVLFGGFFGLAIAYRRKPEIHKRFIVLATVALLFAAAGRMASFIPVPAALFIWFSPLLICIGYDLASRRRLHPVSAIGFGVLLVGLLRLPFATSETWMRMGRAIVRALV